LTLTRSKIARKKMGYRYGKRKETMFGNSVADPDLHESILWEASWIRIHMEDVDPDPGVKN